MTAFTRTSGGLEVTLTEVERAVLVNLARELREVLREASEQSGAHNHTTPPDTDRTPMDAILARLLPDAHPGDPEASTEFRRLTEADLVSGKIDYQRTIIRLFGADATAETTTVTDADAQVLLRALTDLRLALAERLGIRTDDDAERMPAGDDFTRNVYDWLAYLQGSLVDALD